MEGTPRCSLDPKQGWPGLGTKSRKPPLGESVLHVWIMDLESDHESLSMQERLLSAEEWRRVRRYNSGTWGRRFIVRRGLLRVILGQYLDHPPKDIRFVYNVHGKPSIAPEHSSDLQFSLSDSGEKAALALSIGDPIGIDIEMLESFRAGQGLAYSRSLQREIARVGITRTTANSLEFFQAWTRREALAKAEGVGLRIQSDRSRMQDFADCNPPAFSADVPSHERGFFLHSLTLPVGYVGSLAARPQSPRIIYCTA